MSKLLDLGIASEETKELACGSQFDNVILKHLGQDVRGKIFPGALYTFV